MVGRPCMMGIIIMLMSLLFHKQVRAVKCSSLKKGSIDPESDPAMKALSATYQAINLTVRAFNGDTNVGLASQGDYDENFNKHGKIEIESTTDVQSTTSTNVPSTTSTDLPSTKSTDLPSTKSTDVPSTKSTDVPSTKSTDVPLPNQQICRQPNQQIFY
uniref:Uncharacterized protein n=1 Tax=Ciona savignyi TaxID=51511 RepID=H2ZI69_CIOSA